MWWVIVFVTLIGLKTSAQEVITEKAYQLQVQPGWTRTRNLPPGMDVGFAKKMPQNGDATFYFHHEVMPAGSGESPSDTSDMKRQWDAMVKNQYPDVRSVAGAVPRVSGRILVQGDYELTADGKKTRRRYTYFLSGRTAFVVQCSAPPDRWVSISPDCDIMLASLQPGSSASESQTKSDDAAKTELKRNLPTLLSSFPSQWRSSLSDLTIIPSSANGTRTLVIALSFNRTDIPEIYDATRTIFGMIKSGKTDADLNRLPPQTQRAATSTGEFVKYVGQVWGAASGYVANCSPAIERYTLPILDAKGRKVGSISISRKDGAAIIAGQVKPSDARRLAGMYVFE